MKKSPTKTSPLQVARSHCANYDQGACLGLYYNRHLSISACKPLPKCLLCGPIQRCLYFEEVVMRVTVEPSNSHAIFNQAIREYRLATGLLTSEKDQRTCPNCSQRALEKGKKLCYVCREKRRKQTYKSANRRRGRTKNAMTTTV